MSADIVTCVSLGAAIGAAASILTFWARYSRITAAEASAKWASILAAALQVKLEGVQKEFADYREAAALKFVSDRDMIQVEQRFSSLVENIQHDIRGMAERLDRVLDRRASLELQLRGKFDEPHRAEIQFGCVDRAVAAVPSAAGDRAARLAPQQMKSAPTPLVRFAPTNGLVSPVGHV